MELALELQREFGVKVPGAVMKQSRSIRSLATWISARTKAPAPA